MGGVLPRWVALAALGVVGPAAAATTVSHLEEQDRFCIACHTVPEVTYFERAMATALGGMLPPDLSSAHYARASRSDTLMAFRCIDCHRGSGSILHRGVPLALGARDAVIWLTGHADSSVEKAEPEVPFLLTASCKRCHAEALPIAGFENHYHNKLPAAEQAWNESDRTVGPVPQPDSNHEASISSPTTVVCVDCHRAHVHVPGAEQRAYLDTVNVVYPACVRCYEESGRGPLELAARPALIWRTVFSNASDVNVRPLW